MTTSGTPEMPETPEGPAPPDGPDGNTSLIEAATVAGGTGEPMIEC
jgi:hypothetical protein